MGERGKRTSIQGLLAEHAGDDAALCQFTARGPSHTPSCRKHSVHVVVRGLVPLDHDPLEEHPALVRLALDAQDLEHTSHIDVF